MLRVWGRKSWGEGTLRGQGIRLPGRVQAASPCNYEGDCRWETGSSCMCPPGFSAPAALPALPSCPGLRAHPAVAPGSAGLHPPVTVLALGGQIRTCELAKRYAGTHTRTQLLSLVT